MKNNNKSNTVLKSQGIWACTIIGIFALIGGFWGNDGFRIVGIVIACLIVIGIFTILTR